MKETIREFKARIEEEGYILFVDCFDEGKKYYRVMTPDNRQFVGTIAEIKDFIGE